MVFPWFFPFSCSFIPVVLSVMDMKSIVGTAMPAAMSVSPEYGFPQPFPFRVLKLLVVKDFLKALCRCHFAPPFELVDPIVRVLVR